MLLAPAWRAGDAFGYEGITGQLMHLLQVRVTFARRR